MGRPKKSLISRESAVAAAIDVIDADGLDAFSLGSVAQRLGVKAPSLYYHFNDKAELLALVARELLVQVQFVRKESETWEERTISLCVATRRSLLTHPNAAPLLLQFFPRHVLLGAYERAISINPVRPELQMVIQLGLEYLTFGSTLFATSALARGMPQMPEFDPERYPSLTRAIAANPFNEEETLVQALRIFFAGVNALTGGEALGGDRLIGLQTQ